MGGGVSKLVCAFCPDYGEIFTPATLKMDDSDSPLIHPITENKQIESASGSEGKKNGTLEFLTRISQMFG